MNYLFKSVFIKTRLDNFTLVWKVNVFENFISVPMLYFNDVSKFLYILRIDTNSTKNVLCDKCCDFITY